MSDEEQSDYMHAIESVDLWCQRKERTAAILRALDHCVNGWFREFK